MRTRLTTGAVLVAAVALAGSALAAPSLTLESVTVDGATATATGTVAFGEAGDGAVGGTPSTAAPNGAVFAPAGVDLKSASIVPTGSDALTFTWKVSGLPASPPPEVTRYTWSFAVGEKTFQLQAKRSNTASTTVLDEPAGHVTSAATGAFQLRGNCTASYMGTPVSSCPHLKFLSGAFDSAKGEVRMLVPLKDIGADQGSTVLTPIETAGMSISAAYQAAVSNTTVSTFINGWNPYFTAPTVQLATGFGADEDQSGLTYTTATVTDGVFSGSAPVEEGADALVARACVATTCTYVSEPLS